MSEVQAPIVLMRIKPIGEDKVRVNLSDRLRSFEYEDHEKKADLVRFTLDNEDLAHFDDPIFKKGNIVDVTWGYPGNMSPPRQAKIVKISGFNVLTVEALDRGVLMNSRTRKRVYENMTRAEVAQDIARRNGFGPDQQFIQPTNISYPTIAQARLTDAQMMRRLAHKEGFEFYIDFDGFHFHERVMDQDPARVFTYYNAEFNQGAIISIDVENDVYATPGRVKTCAIDPDTKQRVCGTGSNDDTKRKGTGQKLENHIRRDAIEGAVIDAASADARDDADDVERPGSVQGETGNADVKKDADKRFVKSSQVAVKMNMVVVGDPTLLAKTVVRVEGVGKRLTGNYYVKAARHTVGSGYTTELKLISDGTGGYVRPGDILLEEKEQKDPDNKADLKNHLRRDALEGATLDAASADARKNSDGEVTYRDEKGRKNLPGKSE